FRLIYAYLSNGVERSRIGRIAGRRFPCLFEGGDHRSAGMDFANLTERARGLLQAAQMEALAGRHQNLLPEHLLKALIEDPEGLAGHLVRDAGGDPELLRTAAEERLERLPTATGEGPHPIFRSPELATVF